MATCCNSDQARLKHGLHLQETAAAGLSLSGWLVDDGGRDALSQHQNVRVLQMDCNKHVPDSVEELRLSPRRLRWVQCGNHAVPGSFQLTLRPARACDKVMCISHNTLHVTALLALLTFNTASWHRTTARLTDWP
jgi:hypothetical protein